MKKLKDLFKTKKQANIEGLRKWNISLAVIHGLQGVLILILSGSSTLPVTTNYLAIDPLLSSGGQPVLAAGTQTLFNVNLAYLVALFFFMSAIAHVVIATVYRKRYESDLKKGINKARWVEYSISASTMMVAIALLSGVYDFSSLLMIFVLDFIMNMMGLAMELWNQNTKKTNWFSYIIGCVAGIVPWFVFGIYHLIFLQQLLLLLLVLKQLGFLLVLLQVYYDSFVVVQDLLDWFLYLRFQFHLD